MLDEGVVAAAEDLDLAMITGAGFSFWNGGLTMLLEREGLGSFHPGLAARPRGRWRRGRVRLRGQSLDLVGVAHPLSRRGSPPGR